jgi:phage shock protein C
MTTQLFRSRTNSVIGGVCGGLAQYLNIDPVLVRLAAVLLFFATGIGGVLYIVLWIIMPLEPLDRVAPSSNNTFGDRIRALPGELSTTARSTNPRTVVYVGLALVLIGALALIEQLDMPWLTWFQEDLLWPLLLIAGGVALLLRRARPQGEGGAS